ncbi:Rhamnolipids biosynthesis 3-oxoacyl-[acyl-carrier-protein] reductase [Vanrija pseudolonga]|uniref:Rhamnolipids biosynthesis 3-oxoacyl-[acyl-carrier-protein] reductase n=1 Tax=Vanrija pseudolonga TaxID=143232 RepID=A0AAF0Y0R7_9TREE|nr:Rhamnolipids biosynthesis 3-oxoacyl-[acyl-carrier-protein] reductase [Vanrija pseudolonga]
MDASSLFSIKGKIALVTGGGRGVGEMIAAGFVANGAKVYISSRDAAACEATAAALTAQGPGSCVAIPGDLSKYDDCIALAKEIESREGKLDILVNNSGATWGASLEEYPDAAWNKLLTLNVQRVFTLTQALLPALEKGAAASGSPSRVINVGSVNGIDVPVLPTFAYSASKAALHHLTRHLAGHVGKSITVNALALGPFRSKMMKATLDAFEDALAQSLPMKRIGRPEDVAAAAIWLSGPGGEWVTGTIVPVDGGATVYGEAKL